MCYLLTHIDILINQLILVPLKLRKVVCNSVFRIGKSFPGALKMGSNVIRGRTVSQLFRLMKYNLLVSTSVAYIEFYVT